MTTGVIHAQRIETIGYRDGRSDAAGAGRRARAADARPIRIGTLGDQSNITADAGGPGSVAAVRMAVADFGGKVGDRAVEVVSADMLLKPDVAAQIAARWFDVDGVDVILDLPVTSAALAVVEAARAEEVHHHHGRRRSLFHRRKMLGNQCALDRLRLWHGHAAGCGRGDPDRGRQGPRIGAHAARHRRSLGLHAAGLHLGRQGDRAGQRRRRHHSP